MKYKMNLIVSKYLISVTKISLRPFDDKRYTLDNEIIR